MIRIKTIKFDFIKYCIGSILIMTICLIFIVTITSYTREKDRIESEKDIKVETSIEQNLTKEELKKGREVALKIAEDAKNNTTNIEQNKISYGIFEIKSMSFDEAKVNGITSPHEGTAASSDFPVGTKLDIVGVGTFEVVSNDTIPEVIKIFLLDKDTCNRFGGKDAEVYVINE